MYSLAGSSQKKSRVLFCASPSYHDGGSDKGEFLHFYRPDALKAWAIVSLQKIVREHRRRCGTLPSQHDDQCHLETGTAITYVRSLQDGTH